MLVQGRWGWRISGMEMVLEDKMRNPIWVVLVAFGVLSHLILSHLFRAIYDDFVVFIPTTTLHRRLFSILLLFVFVFQLC